MVLLTREDKILIKSLRESFNYGARKLVRLFPQKNWRVRTISKFLKHLRETNGSIEIKQGRGRKRTVRTEENIDRVRGIVENLRPGQITSSRRISKVTRIKRTSVRRILKTDLDLKIYKKIYCQKLTHDVKQRRVERCERLLRRFRAREQIEKIWFSDEKVFCLRQPRNTQNNRVYTTVDKKRDIPLENLLIPRQHFASSIMASVAISAVGKTSIIFVDSRINSEVYQRDILSNMLPVIEEVCDLYTFQQDGAPAHTSRETVRFLQEHCPDFIEPNNWPPNSPDLNPVDYCIWGLLENMVYYNHTFETIRQLKDRIQECWAEFPQDVITNAIGQFRRRLQAVVDNQGGHIHRHFL